MTKQKLRASDMALAGMFAALMGIGANITSFAPFLQIGGIPLTMQPFFCLLAGLLLGRRLGALSMIVYALVGFIGAPVFASFSGGISALFKGSGGFILSYIPAAYAAGWITDRKSEPKAADFFTASVIGTLIIYLIGVNYMYFAFKTWLNTPITYSYAWVMMTWFFIKDLAFSVLLAALASKVYKAVQKAAGFKRNPTF
ncbi:MULTISPECIES: biotin transporter BioY [Bacillus]|uniref:biotin transporter BioY n=1 Tax=Bacillus TaxID=1386 RepID=UPI00040823B8|nr:MULTISPECIES: biotin transporter BioY [Bacillus]QHZ45752.1 biotin transporter BioY [Bacillus sp. NSP9.1]WFA04386.1 biotin transporter BioY [Bacillus sp. HSf4]